MNPDSESEHSPRQNYTRSVLSSFAYSAAVPVSSLLGIIPSSLLARVLENRLSAMTVKSWNVVYTKQLNISSLSQINSLNDSTYTGRMSYVRKLTDMRSLGIEYSSPGATERSYRRWLQKKGFAMIELAEDYGLDALMESEWKGDLSQESLSILKEIIHEHTHWRMLQGASISALIDRAAWRVRVMQLILCEQIHVHTQVPRSMDFHGVFEIRKNKQLLELQLERLSENRQLRDIFADLVNHLFQITLYFQDVVAPIVEPATWALVEPTWRKNPDSRLGEYFPHLPTRRVAEKVWAGCERFLDTKNSNLKDKSVKRKQLIQKANSAFDFPLNEAREFVEGGNGDSMPFKRYVERRLERLLNNEQVSAASASDKLFSKILGYAVSPPRLHGGQTRTSDEEYRKLFLETGLRILRDEPAVVRYGAMMALTSSDRAAAECRTVLVNTQVNGEYLKLRFDELTGLTAEQGDWSPIGKLIAKRTQEPLNKIDDVVGHLPGTLSATLMLGFYLGLWDDYSRHVAANGDSQYQHLVDTVRSKIAELGQLINFANGGTPEEFSTAYLNFIKAAFNNIDLVPTFLRESGPRSDMLTNRWRPGDPGLREFLRFWLELVAQLGESAKYFWVEHGWS